MLISAPKEFTYTKSKIIQAKRKNLCPVCGGSGCGLIEGGKIVLCWRVSSGAVKQSSNGSWVHIVNDFTIPTFIPSIVKPRIVSNNLDTVYNAFLDLLPLREKHHNQLSKFRKLSDDTIKSNKFKSIPTSSEARAVCSKLGKELNLEYVPGFYFSKEWKLNIKGDGFFVPYRDVKGLIQGMQARYDFGNTRYLWVSSGKLNKGAGSGSPIHYSRPDLVTDTIWITEGALKGICISEYKMIPVIAMAGVSAVNYETLFNQIRADLPSVNKINICFDMDWESNRMVKGCLERMVVEARNQNYEVFLQTWDIKLGKGYDDRLKRNYAT